MTSLTEQELVQFIQGLDGRLRAEIHRRVVGQERTIDLVLVALLGGGHCLLTGVPGLAKTMLVKALSEVTSLAFSRIQFTPDLMPSDITGTEVIEEDRATGSRSFTFVRGPVFTNLLLADEVNRTPPKTQGALLQAMQEHQVTVMGRTHVLDEPFHVIATQNPIEQEGTYPLPEALLDRFLLGITMDYPTAEEEGAIVTAVRSDQAPLNRVISRDELLQAQRLVDRVPVSDHIVAFIVRLVRATRPSERAPQFINEFLSWGAGPRAAQNLLVAAKARALLAGEPSPRMQHATEMAEAVLAHRLVLSFRAESEKVKEEELLRELIRQVG